VFKEGRLPAPSNPETYYAQGPSKGSEGYVDYPET
jgi:hypothetical protein